MQWALPVGLALALILFGRTRRQAQYVPGSPEAVALFAEAARAGGYPVEWANSRGLHELLDAESDGWVGRPNYTYGDLSNPDNRTGWPHVWRSIQERDPWRYTVPGRSHSSAVGLGQLIQDNQDRHMPSGRDGLGDALEEAVGMLSYIAERYGDPDAAWTRYNSSHEGY